MHASIYSVHMERAWVRSSIPCSGGSGGRGSPTLPEVTSKAEPRSVKARFLPAFGEEEMVVVYSLRRRGLWQYQVADGEPNKKAKSRDCCIVWEHDVIYRFPRVNDADTASTKTCAAVGYSITYF